MTNASKNIVLFSLLAFALSFGSFANIVNAQVLGYGDTYGSNLGYGDTLGSNLGYGDTYGGNLGYGDTYGTNLGYGDTYGNNLGYGDSYGNNLGYGDTYGSNLGYGDTFGSNLGYGDTYGSNLGYGDTNGSNLGYGDTYGGNLGYGDTYGSNLGYGDTYGTNASNTYSPSNTYSSIPSYATSYIPQSAAQYIPGYSSFDVNPSTYSASYPYYAPSVSTPRPGTAGITTQSQNQSQSSYNSNPNTNINPNSNTNTNTTGPSNSTSNASTGAITNTNVNNPVASNGPITISNNVNVVPLSQAQPQRLVQYNLPTPSCTISASNSYTYGNYSNQPMTLTWSSSNATSAYISPNVGSVNPSGSTIVYPQGYTTYTLTISGPGGSATCQSTANTPSYVAPSYIAPAPIYTQPASPSVSLTQIPYTGFDYGPVGDAIYWMGLLAFALAGAYLMIYYRGGALAFAGSLIGSGSNAREIYSYDEVEEEVASAPVAAPVAASVVAATPTPAFAFASRELPTMENHRITTDSMIIDRSSHGTPRIVIARN
jgi:hypothetical protein